MKNLFAVPFFAVMVSPVFGAMASRVFAAEANRECYVGELNEAGDELIVVSCTVYTDDVGTFSISVNSPAVAGGTTRMRLNADGTIRTGDLAALPGLFTAAIATKYAELLAAKAGVDAREAKKGVARESLRDALDE